jgi:hypothetical protein
MGAAKQPGYRSYLLRLWQVSTAEPSSWRMSLEDVRTHERRNFASLEQLFAFLIEETGAPPVRDDAAPDNPL